MKPKKKITYINEIMDGKVQKATGTGGAVPIRNDKGEVVMQKVKVQRYVAGKRPKYAPDSDTDEELEERTSEKSSDEEDAAPTTSRHIPNVDLSQVDDRRLKRLMDVDNERRERPTRHRQVAEPVILEAGQDEDENDQEEEEAEPKQEPKADSDNEEDDIDEEERMRKRLELKKRALQRQEELMVVEDEQKQQSDGSEEESDETDETETDEEYSDSEDEIAPRLKPVFVRKSDRVTIQEKEALEEKEKELEAERGKLRLEAKKETKKIIEMEVAKEKLSEKENDDNIQCDFDTDGENNEEDYEMWKLRELRRIKRDRDERDALEKEKQEILRVRNMTEEERAEYLKANPKVLVNEANKGKYKYLQKYYHRGAFFMDEDDEVFKRNFAEPTLEDHFDKTILPKVMQVKNFGMSGRTKYTHLLDQDTTRKEDNPWANQEKFIMGKGGGTKQVFSKPTAKKTK